MRVDFTSIKRPFRNSKVPLLLESVPAGFPSPADDYIEEIIDLNEICQIDLSFSYCVRAIGYSMTNSGIWPGDLLTVRRDFEPNDGDTVVASIDGESFVKIFRKRGKSVYFEAANEEYPDIVPQDEQDVRVWGVVVTMIRVLR